MLLHLSAYLCFVSLLKEIEITNELISKSPWIIIICTIFFFHTGSAESMLWAMASIQSSAVLALLVLTAYWLNHKSQYGWVIALLFSSLAPFAQGNGLLLPFLVAFYFAMNKKYWALLISIILSLGHLAIFLSKPSSSEIQISFDQITSMMIFSFSFLGSAFSIGGNNFPTLTLISLIPSVTIGVLVWVVAIEGLIHQEENELKRVWRNPFFFMVIFFLGTSLLAALTRSQFGLSQAMVSRYHIYSSFTLLSAGFLLISIKEKFQFLLKYRQYQIQVISAISVILYLFSFIFFLHFYTRYYAGIRRQEILFPNREEAIQILDQSTSKGIFMPFTNKKN
ncbi:MAG: hypothetical protein SFU91_14075 [Chloroherpetonaceae bacterium]|nr:hypothetical protein [Chloroherpetonaceae bacterium]